MDIELFLHVHERFVWNGFQERFVWNSILWHENACLSVYVFLCIIIVHVCQDDAALGLRWRTVRFDV